MLARSFVFLQGIGPVRESRLWRRGIETWAQYRELPRVQGVRPRLKELHDVVLGEAEARLGRDAPFFARLLPSHEHWRAYNPFREGAAFLDIETTGDRSNQVTVVGVRHRGENRAFVRLVDGRPAEGVADAGAVPYTPEAVGEFLQDATLLVTFNGGSFDLPVLAGEGVPLPRVPHVDLRTVFSRLGETGGLKKIEDRLGFGRTGDLAGLTGWDAVKLWRRWQDRGDAEALRTLVAYNVADFENLEPLAAHACGQLMARTLDPMGHQTRLPEAPPEGVPVGR